MKCVHAVYANVQAGSATKFCQKRWVFWEVEDVGFLTSRGVPLEGRTHAFAPCVTTFPFSAQSTAAFGLVFQSAARFGPKGRRDTA